ncbi:hypothetical protein A2483_03865 [Candidatus Peregrinibacteria bacterium RIFOXYC2_FULL_33_13]|nr:MAG: hypothetical protein UR27_C0002G0050 [Candidatus Peregrinibacteria bacterium GW2011_GWA2_33_10]KKP41065.1 MAG: hypothetical protein UR30_C0002G0099 [Candidatus Peregrinibacteria bacterium GW2011_GWC2_33_13]OGJ52850.1 MAG: hypothetical protein A2483_03865 [Candidatus Peregrinibacteria bacterium RIFOXYC2_FULL_33_13]
MKKITTIILSIVFILTACAQFLPQNNGSQGSENSGNEKIAYMKNIYEKEGKNFIDIDEIKWLSEVDNTCTTSTEEATNEIPECNPNGFLIVNDEEKIVTFEIPSDLTVYTANLGQDPSSGNALNVKIFTEVFNGNKETFEFAPFEIKVDGDKVLSLKERYIP